MLYDSHSEYLPRYIDRELDLLMPSLRAAAIDGAKSVGKTETAMRRVDRIYRLDIPSEREIFETSPEGIINVPQGILIDEWQHVPASWDLVRRAVDDRREGLRLLTGSASPIAGVTTHSGAGRILSFRMRPLALSERPSTRPTVFIENLFNEDRTIEGETDFSVNDYAQEVCASGFPGMIDHSPRGKRREIDTYINRIIDRDITELGQQIRRPDALLSWLRAYAAATGTTASYSEILDAATPGENTKPSRATTQNYRDLLSKLWILDPLPAWTPTFSPFKRLKTGVKHYLVDPAISAALMGLTVPTLMDPQSGTVKAFGHLFEALAVLTARGAAGVSEAKAYHFHTAKGEHEVDIVLENHEGRIIGFEVKLKASISDADVRHLHWLKQKLGDRMIDQVVVTTGRYAYRRKDGIAVVPLALLA